MKLVHVSHVSGDLYALREFHAPVDPGYDTGVFPHPGGGPAHNPVFPNNTLPAGPPTQIGPGETLVLIRDPEGVWHYAALAPASPPPRPVPPGPPVHIGGMPPGTNLPSNALPGMPPNMATNPIAPGAAPKR